MNAKLDQIETPGQTIIICGPTCSGKTTLLKELDSRGYLRIVTYTSRPARQNEIHGEDYHFINKELFESLIAMSFFIEHMIYSNNGELFYYGTAKHYFKIESPKVIVLDPMGVHSLVDLFGKKPFFIVWLDTPSDICVERALNRGTKIQAVNERIREDVARFDILKKSSMYDLRITKEMNVEELADLVIKQANRKKDAVCK